MEHRWSIQGACREHYGGIAAYLATTLLAASEHRCRTSAAPRQHLAEKLHIFAVSNDNNKQHMTFRSHILLVVATISLAACQSHIPTYQRNTGFVFGTSYNLIYRADSSLANQVMARLGAYDASLSVYNKNSLLSSLNANDTVAADSLLLYVVSQAKHFHHLSNGAFDITVEPLSRLWRFTSDLRDDTISVERFDSLVAGLDTVMPLVGLDKITIDGNVIRKADRRMKINANALAEGYGIDLAAYVLDEAGVTDYMVEIGGEIHCRGLNPRGGKWRIGIDQPIEGSGVLDRKTQRIIEVTDCAVSTSGFYRQCYHIADGRRVQHTIDPRTGMPVTHSMESVTVVGPNTMTTDALCTTLMVLGPDSALQKIDSYPGIEAYIIYRDEHGIEREQMTDGFRLLLADRHRE